MNQLVFRVIVYRFTYWYFLAKPNGDRSYKDERIASRRGREAIREGADEARVLWSMDGRQWSVFKAWVRQYTEEAGFVNVPRAMSEAQHPDGWRVPTEIRAQLAEEMVKEGLDTK